MTRVIIEINGGCFVAAHADQEIELSVIDYDNHEGPDDDKELIEESEKLPIHTF